MTSGSRPGLLSGCSVVDFSTGLAGPYCSHLLVAAGADVVKVEPDTGDPMRWWSATGAVPEGQTSPMFRFLNAGKRGVCGRPDTAAMQALTRAADILVESFVPAQLDSDARRRTTRRLWWCP
jgi:crotonobetainyl-CoA:carnitine CoA-transferase CaiB-like acyl-CoA transferase